MQDGSIAVCKLSDGKPLRHWQGAHSADINSLRWEPSGKLLASCSDDGTVKIWQATSDKPVHTLSGGAWLFAAAAAAALAAQSTARRRVDGAQNTSSSWLGAAE